MAMVPVCQGLIIPCNTTIPAQTIELPVTVDAGIICVVGLTRRYVVNGNAAVDKQWLVGGCDGKCLGGWGVALR
jgi:hypothetical protein